MLTAEELIGGGELTFEVEIPEAVLRPSEPGNGNGAGELRRVRLRPLTVRDLQLVVRAAKEQDELVATLMIQRALVEPKMEVAQVGRLQAGLARHLLDQVNRLSGIEAEPGSMDDAASAPLARATLVLAREFGWTPEEVHGLTLGQILLYLELLHESGGSADGRRPGEPG